MSLFDILFTLLEHIFFPRRDFRTSARCFIPTSKPPNDGTSSKSDRRTQRSSQSRVRGPSLIGLLGKKARLVGNRTEAKATTTTNEAPKRKQALSLFYVTFTSIVKPARNHQLISSSSMDDGSDKAYSPDLANRGAGMSSSSLPPTTTSVHVTALDGVVNVNSLFTIAVFVGLSLTTPGQHSLENPGGCDAGIGVVKRLLVFEVVSFSFFLFSSLVAQGLKLAINLLNSNDVDEAFRAKISLKVLRLGMLGSAVGSVMGCLFLMLSMVCVIEIRLGTLSCGSRSAIDAVSALVVLVSSALLVYISTAVYSFML